MTCSALSCSLVCSFQCWLRSNISIAQKSVSRILSAGGRPWSSLEWSSRPCCPVGRDWEHHFDFDKGVSRLKSISKIYHIGYFLHFLVQYKLLYWRKQCMQASLLENSAELWARLNSWKVNRIQKSEFFSKKFSRLRIEIVRECHHQHPKLLQQSLHLHQ